MVKILIFLVLVQSSIFSKTDLESSISQAVSIQTAFNEVFRKTSDSVVSISTEKTVEFNNMPFGPPFFRIPNENREFRPEKQKQKGIGSGIILSKDGFVLTNQHVIQNVDKVIVKLKNKKVYEAEVVGLDKQMDIALLKIKGVNDLQAIEIADSSKVNVGDWSIAIGAPMGFEHSFTVGVVSAISRGVDDSGVGFIQTDASINQGNSGGPLLDIYGRVIGINRMIVSQSGGSIGIGFAIPINEAKRIADELKLNGKIKRPWVGIKITTIDEQSKQELKLPSVEGALVHQIYTDSPAVEAGIELMDFVIQVDDSKIRSADELVSIVRKSKIGDRLNFVIIRKGKEMKLSVKLREMPNG